MPDEIKIGTVLIKDGAALPKALGFESESCVPGWKLVKHLDGNALNRKVHETGWNFFFEAGEFKATVFGINRQQMARRAIERILRDPRSKRFNSLEIMQMTAVGSERFPGVSFLTVRANVRHIQESLVLFHVKDPAKPEPNANVDRNANGLDSRPNQDAELTSGSRRREETSRQSGLAAVSGR
jgi:hypothetical protein